MEQTINQTENKKAKQVAWNILNNISCVCEAIADSNLHPQHSLEYNRSMAHLNEYFGAHDLQTWILCFAIWQHFNDNSYILPREFASYLNTDVLKIAGMHKDFINLRKRGLLEYSDSKSTFNITNEVIKSVVNNEIIPSTLNDKITYIDFVRKVADKYENRKYTDDNCDDLVSQLNNMEERYSELPLVIRSKDFFKNDKIRFMFYDICNDCLIGCPTHLISTVEDIYENNEKYMIGRQFMDGKHFFQQTGMIEFVDKGKEIIDTTIRLSEKGKKFFLDSDYSLYETKLDDSKLKKPCDIKTKKLFYSEENQKQIDDLTQSLSQSKFTKIQKRLNEKGLPSGIAVIFHGAPGCGKTESVYQIAKKTGRAIMQVDISNTKSCWFGESEKLIKKVFTDYKDACKIAAKMKNGRTPILLFNECDAVFGKRKDVTHSNTAQEENAIQNIILEELEKLDGILIATTNLTENLDPAFERRFLFKIRFENPSVEAKKAIWKNKMKWITPAQAQSLAERYNFSGGEIENIVRKAEMKEIISGHRPAWSDILDMCKVEKLNAPVTEKRMGFAV